MSPSRDSLTVNSSDSVRFEVRINDASLTAEYQVDQQTPVPGPVFVLHPFAHRHTVLLFIRSSVPGEGTTVRSYVVQVVGNLLPRIDSFTVDPKTGEAARDTFRIRVVAQDDGAVQSISVDFGDGTPPSTNGPASTSTVSHVYQQPGNYTLRATVVDDAGGRAAASTSVEVRPSNQLPTGRLVAFQAGGGEPIGRPPLHVILRPDGADADGSIVQWEIDVDGAGVGEDFRTILPRQEIVATYDRFSEIPYVPLLRLTDDRGGRAVIPADNAIRVLRPVYDWTVSNAVGNGLFNGTGIAPAIWSDGLDPARVTVNVRDERGAPLAGVPLQVASLRAPTIAPDGVRLSPTETILPETPVTGLDGTATFSVRSNLSTRFEDIQTVTFTPFSVRVEADLGHGQRLSLGEVGNINAESIASSTGGTVFVSSPNGGRICRGDQVTILVRATRIFNAPGGLGPASNRYVTLFSRGKPLPVTPATSREWRTDGNGEIRFLYDTRSGEAGFEIRVDGRLLKATGDIVFSANCP